MSNGIYDRLTGLTDGGHLTVTEQGVRLPRRHALLVKLENWALLPDLSAANPVDVLYGFNGQYLHWLNAGGSTDDMIVPAEELSTICLRTKPGETCIIFYSWKL